MTRGEGGIFTTSTSGSVSVGDSGNPSPSGEARSNVTWRRATAPLGSAHEERPEGASGVDTEAPQSGTGGGGRGSCARPDPANCDRARIGDRIWQDRARPRALAAELSTEPAAEPDRAVAEGYQLAGVVTGVSPSTKELLGKALLGAVISRREYRKHNRRDDSRVYRGTSFDVCRAFTHLCL